LQLSKNIRDQYNEATQEEVSSSLLSKAINDKLNELETYYNSQEARLVKVSGHTIINSFDFRALMDEQKDRFREKIDLGLITEDKAIFNYRYNGSGIIPINYQQLRMLGVGLKDLASANFTIKQGHREAIRSLQSVSEVEAYNVESDFIINQEYSL